MLTPPVVPLELLELEELLLDELVLDELLELLELELLLLVLELLELELSVFSPPHPVTSAAQRLASKIVCLYISVSSNRWLHEARIGFFL